MEVLGVEVFSRFFRSNCPRHETGWHDAALFVIAGHAFRKRNHRGLARAKERTARGGIDAAATRNRNEVPVALGQHDRQRGAHKVVAGIEVGLDLMLQVRQCSLGYFALIETAGKKRSRIQSTERGASLAHGFIGIFRFRQVGFYAKDRVVLRNAA